MNECAQIPQRALLKWPQKAKNWGTDSMIRVRGLLKIGHVTLEEMGAQPISQIVTKCDMCGGGLVKPKIWSFWSQFDHKLVPFLVEAQCKKPSNTPKNHNIHTHTGTSKAHPKHHFWRVWQSCDSGDSKSRKWWQWWQVWQWQSPGVLTGVVVVVVQKCLYRMAPSPPPIWSSRWVDTLPSLPPP
jgi:hypothetical protein